MDDLYEWDAAKAALNLRKHGVPFTAAANFEWAKARHLYDEAHSAVEPRYRSIGFNDDRLHVMVWTARGSRIRIIGLRKANNREIRNYAGEKT